MIRSFRLAAVFAASLAAASSASACGGDGQAPCTTAPASYVQSTHCDPGTFNDPRNGGECWSCDGWARTLNAVTSGAACSKAGYTATAHAAYTGKPRGFDCPKGSFYDPRNWGECWSCSGWDRSASAVTASDACTRAYPEQTKAARYVKASHCSAGSVWDPRNGGECWACPAGYDRNANPVDGGAACSARSACSAGNILYGGVCWTKGACGGKDGRACTLAERVPSCDAGLKEVAGRCEPLRPGENAVLGAIGDWAKSVSDQGEAACEAAFKALPKAKTGNPILDAEGECYKNMTAGFSCAVTGIPGQLQGLTEMVRKTGLEWDRDPCGKLLPGDARAACAVLYAVGRDAGDAVQCAIDSMKGVPAGRIDPMRVCHMEGELAFTLALMALGDEVAAAEEGPAAVIKLALKANDALGKANDANELSEAVRNSAACKKVVEQGAAAKSPTTAVFTPRSEGAYAPGALAVYRFGPDGGNTQAGRGIGSAWAGLTVLPAGGGVVYAVNAAGDLLYYKHDGAGNWSKAGVKAGSAWGQFKAVVSGGDGVLYAVRPTGELLMYTFSPDGVNLSMKQIGAGWSGFKRVVAGGGGVLYGVAQDGDLYYYKHDAAATSWGPSGQKIGTGWDFPLIVSTGGGRLFVSDATGVLRFYQHDASGNFQVSNKGVGSGWGVFSAVAASPNGDGAVYGVAR